MENTVESRRTWRKLNERLNQCRTLGLISESKIYFCISLQAHQLRALFRQRGLVRHPGRAGERQRDYSTRDDHRQLHRGSDEGKSSTVTQRKFSGEIAPVNPKRFIATILSACALQNRTLRLE